MSIKLIDSEALAAWVDTLVGDQQVVGVQARDDRFAFEPLKKACDLRLDYDVTILPPKEYLQPPREGLLTFKEGEGYTAVSEKEPMILFGVHPYDAVAIGQMDEVFSQDQSDARYVDRRAGITIVATDVQSASANTFAGHMGTAHIDDGCDILLSLIGDKYLVDIKTEKGEAIAGSLKDAPEADAAALDARAKLWDDNDALMKQLDLKAEPGSWPELLDKSYDSGVWDERAKKCFSCGSCTLTCPTCYCLDVRESVDWSLKSGKRDRVWDGCMLTQFAEVAGEHNFRKDRANRYRHRYYRKGKYLPSKIGGSIACVGCGRCVTACVAGIASPVEVFNVLAEGA
jgi:sulfhydrogenase subunit beta (sulfur reductase)